MRQVNVHEAKSQLSKLLEDVERGEEVTIARNGVPVAKLSRIGATRRTGFGSVAEFGDWTPERLASVDAAVAAALADEEAREHGDLAGAPVPDQS